jgi:outer membrane protein TolC
MRTFARTLRRFPLRLLSGLSLPLCLPLAAGAWPAGFPGQEPPAVVVQVQTQELPALVPAADAPAPVAQPAAPVVVQALTLADCVRIALEQQPSLAASRASLAAADANRRALDNLRVPSFIVRELPYRREQANLGVTVAAAGLQQAEQDAIYAVTRSYFSVLYARAQGRVANQVVNDLGDALANARRLVGQAGAPRDLTQNAVDRNRAFLNLAESRRVDAQEGVQRALAALREAIGAGPDFVFTVAGDELPEPRVEVSRDYVVGLAVARRGEITQAALLARVTCLEVDAQGTSCRPKKETFAAVVDIHAKPIPAGESDGDYRPGALAPEMPTTLVGSRSARMERARDLQARAAAVTDKTRNLIALEAEDAFLRYEQAAQKMPKAREAVTVANRAARDTLNDFKGGQNVPYRDVLETQILAAQAGVQYNEARYQYLLALAALERVTGGGFSAGLTGAPAAPQ